MDYPDPPPPGKKWVKDIHGGYMLADDEGPATKTQQGQKAGEAPAPNAGVGSAMPKQSEYPKIVDGVSISWGEAMRQWREKQREGGPRSAGEQAAGLKEKKKEQQ